MLKAMLIYGLLLILLLAALVYVRYFFIQPFYEQKAYFRQLHQHLALGQQVRCLDQQQGTIIELTSEIATIRLLSGDHITVPRCSILEIVDNEIEYKRIGL